MVYEILTTPPASLPGNDIKMLDEPRISSG
jgi:hypothetical protein